MHWCSRLIVALAIAAALFAASCGGSKSDLGGNTTPSANPQQIGEIKGLPPIPVDDSEPGRAVSTGEGSMSILGKDFLAELNGTVVGNALELDAPAGANDNSIAYGLYKMSGLNGKKALRLYTECLPGFEKRYYVGVANYSGGEWEWFGPSSLPELEINLEATGHRYITELGNLYFMVVCHDNNSATHFQTTLNYADDSGHAPGMPKELVASDGEFPFAVKLHWLPAPGAANYEIWRRVHESNTEYVKIGISQEPFFVDEQVDAQVVYQYKVRSANEYGYSDFCYPDTGFASGEAGDPWCPGNLWASDGLYTDKVRLEWQAGEGLGWFKVYRRVHNSDDWAPIGESEINSYNDTTADPGVYYMYKVEKRSELHLPCFSGEDKGFRSGGAGCDFQAWATDGAFPDKVVVEWQSVREGVWYDVLRKRKDVQEDFAIIGGETQLNRYEDFAVDPGVVYQYKIRAYLDNAPCDSNIDLGYAHGDGGGGADWCPGGLVASDGTYADKVRLEWLPGGGDAYYFKVYRHIYGHDVWDLVGSTELPNFNDTTAEPGVTYIYKVVKYSQLHEPCESNYDGGYRAQGGGGGGDWCPTGFMATDGSYAEKVRMEWNPGSGDGYWFKIFRRTVQPAGDWVMLGESTVGSYEDFTAEPGVIYNYKVVKYAPNVNECASNDDNGHRPPV